MSADESVGQSQFSLAVCFPVWNRADLFKSCFDSLILQLVGIHASIWIFDNGSDEETRGLIARMASEKHRLVKVTLPENMGIPFVVNMFSQMLTHGCDFVGYRTPDYVMLADADAYFTQPIRNMIEILNADRSAAIVSGHDSIEHETLSQYQFDHRDGSISVKEKLVERGLCLLMKKEILAACVPFPHDRYQDVDWQLMTRHPNSIAARGLKLLAVDNVVHIGLYDSTWHSIGVPADQAEVDEINRILRQEGLFSPARKNRMENYCREFNLRPIQDVAAG